MNSIFYFFILINCQKGVCIFENDLSNMAESIARINVGRYFLRLKKKEKENILCVGSPPKGIKDKIYRTTAVIGDKVIINVCKKWDKKGLECDQRVDANVLLRCSRSKWE